MSTKTVYSTDFVRAVAVKASTAMKADGKSKISQEDVKLVLDCIGDVILDLAVEKGEIEVSLPEFCKFFVKLQDAKTARNPKTGAEVNVPAKYRATAKLSPKFKKFIGEIDIVEDDEDDIEDGTEEKA